MFIAASTPPTPDPVDHEAGDRAAARRARSATTARATPIVARLSRRASPLPRRALSQVARAVPAAASTETVNRMTVTNGVAHAVLVLERRQVGEQDGEAQTLGGEGCRHGDPGTPRVWLHGQESIVRPWWRSRAGPTGRAPSSTHPVRQTHPATVERAGRAGPRRPSPRVCGSRRSASGHSFTGVAVTDGVLRAPRPDGPDPLASTCRRGQVTVEAGMPLHELNAGARRPRPGAGQPGGHRPCRRSPAPSRPARTAPVARWAVWPRRSIGLELRAPWTVRSSQCSRDGATEDLSRRRGSGSARSASSRP